jgi:hypothetical protein
VISPTQRPVHDNTQHPQKTNIHAPGGIRTHNSSKRAALVRAVAAIGSCLTYKRKREPAFNEIELAGVLLFSVHISFRTLLRLRRIDAATANVIVIPDASKKKRKESKKRKKERKLHNTSYALYTKKKM